MTVTEIMIYFGVTVMLLSFLGTYGVAKLDPTLWDYVFFIAAVFIVPYLLVLVASRKGNPGVELSV